MSAKLFRVHCPAGAAAILALLAFSLTTGQASAAPATKKAKAPAAVVRKTPKPIIPPVPEVPPSAEATRLMAWVATARDNGSLPYIVIDKHAATLFLFKSNGTLVGRAPVLIGVGVGDDSSPGVGAKSLAEIGPAERTTPAGRFVSKFGRAFGNTRVLWVDYANSVALHAVDTANKKERRVARLLSPLPDDNRVTFGCINVGTSFYAKQVRPLLQKAGGVVYILPDTKTLDEVFPRVRLLPYLNAEDAE